MNKTNVKKFFTGAVVIALAMTAAELVPAQAKTPTHSVKSNKTVKITEARANAIVLKQFPGKLAAKTILENEEGKWQYGVMVRSGKILREVMVGAYSGKIETVEVTTSAKENIEKD